MFKPDKPQAPKKKIKVQNLVEINLLSQLFHPQRTGFNVELEIDYLLWSDVVKAKEKIPVSDPKIKISTGMDQGAGYVDKVEFLWEEEKTNPHFEKNIKYKKDLEEYREKLEKYHEFQEKERRKEIREAQEKLEKIRKEEEKLLSIINGT